MDFNSEDPLDQVPEGCSPSPDIIFRHPSLGNDRKSRMRSLVGNAICAMAFQARLHGLGTGYILSTTLAHIQNKGGYSKEQVRDALAWLSSAKLMKIEADPDVETCIHIRLLFRYSREGGTR